MPSRPPRGLPRPRKRYGQHFLTDRRILERIAEALGADETSRVVEIGAGRGSLTDVLVARSASVIAIEIDRDLVAHLKTRYAGNERVRIVEGDALRVDWSAVAGGSFLLTGNLPYNVTSPILFKALEPPLPKRTVFLVQREVAERIVAAPGGRDYGALSVNVQVATEVEIIAQVPAGAFYPKPRVDSSVIRLTPRRQPLISEEEAAPFRRFVQAMFGMRRKQLLRAVREIDALETDAAMSALTACGILPTARAETLTPQDLVRLFRARA